MVKYIVKPTGPFRKDLKLAKRRGLPLNDLFTVVEMLENDTPLPTNRTKLSPLSKNDNQYL